MKWQAYPKYKDSGIEWLGEIPAHWEVKQIRRTTKSHKQGYYTSQDYLGEGVKLARITDIDDFGNINFDKMPYVDTSENEEKTFKIEKDDFLFARSGTIGRFGIAENPERSVFASYLIRFKFKNVDVNYARYFYLSHFFKESLYSTLHGGANQNIHAENIKDQFICMGNINEQRAIAAFLDHQISRIDKPIAMKERQIELLQEKRAALISHAVTKGLDPNAKMKDSHVEWLGKIPEHWNVKRLKYLSSVNDETLEENTNPDYEILYVDISNVDAVLGIKRKVNMAFKNAPSRARRKVKHGDIIVSTVRTYLKAITPIDNPESNLIVSTGFAVIRPICEFDSKFASFVLRASYFVDTVVANSVGVSYPAINASELITLYIALPPIPEQHDISKFLDHETGRIDALTEKIRKSIDMLHEYRTALTSAAVTGKIDVRVEVVE